MSTPRITAARLTAGPPNSQLYSLIATFESVECTGHMVEVYLPASGRLAGQFKAPPDSGRIDTRFQLQSALVAAQMTLPDAAGRIYLHAPGDPNHGKLLRSPQNLPRPSKAEAELILTDWLLSLICGRIGQENWAHYLGRCTF